MPENTNNSGVSTPKHQNFQPMNPNPEQTQETPLTKQTKQPTKSGKKRKNIFISYSIESDYAEKKFVSDVVESFKKEYNLENDIWCDFEEKCLGTSHWMASRLEMAERCRATVVFLSNSFMDNRQCVIELKTMLERSREHPKSVRIYIVLYESAELSSAINEHISGKVDLREYNMSNISEKVFVTAGSVGPQLEKKFSSAKGTSSDKGTDVQDGEKVAFKERLLLHWGVNDVQHWLKSKGVPSFQMDAFLERGIDGFLLASLSEAQLAQQLMIDNRHIIKKIPELVTERINADMQREECWHYKFKNFKEKPSTIYIIFDPKDLPIVFHMKRHFEAKGFIVMYHEHLGSSRDEFLKKNGPIMAQCANFLVIISESGGTSPFVYNETVRFVFH